MKNQAFKMWIVNHGVDRDGIARIILHLLAEKNDMAFELMEECDAPFVLKGYKKAADFVLNQCADHV